eukprot:gene8519-3829_t
MPSYVSVGAKARSVPHGSWGAGAWRLEQQGGGSMGKGAPSVHARMDGSSEAVKIAWHVGAWDWSCDLTRRTELPNGR